MVIFHSYVKLPEGTPRVPGSMFFLCDHPRVVEINLLGWSQMTKIGYALKAGLIHENRHVHIFTQYIYIYMHMYLHMYVYIYIYTCTKRSYNINIICVCEYVFVYTWCIWISFAHNVEGKTCASERLRFLSLAPVPRRAISWYQQDTSISLDGWIKQQTAILW